VAASVLVSGAIFFGLKDKKMTALGALGSFVVSYLAQK
jgi:hypothetical protein